MSESEKSREYRKAYPRTGEERLKTVEDIAKKPLSIEIGNYWHQTFVKVGDVSIPVTALSTEIVPSQHTRISMDVIGTRLRHPIKIEGRLVREDEYQEYLKWWNTVRGLDWPWYIRLMSWLERRKGGNG